MYTYIKKDVIGNYLTVDVLLDTIDGYQDAVGNDWKDYMEGKFILLSFEQLQFRDNNPEATVEEVFNMKINEPEIVPEPVIPEPERTLEDAKLAKRDEIEEYDMSEHVNGFYIGSDLLWLDKATRAGLLLRFQAEEASGDENTTLWYGVKSYTLPLMLAKQMLLQIEKYASVCYDNTQSHYAVVDALETIEDVDNFDVTIGYPNMLHFNLM